MRPLLRLHAEGIGPVICDARIMTNGLKNCSLFIASSFFGFLWYHHMMYHNIYNFLVSSHDTENNERETYKMVHSAVSIGRSNRELYSKVEKYEETGCI